MKVRKAIYIALLVCGTGFVFWDLYNPEHATFLYDFFLIGFGLLALLSDKK